jgi:hypothetical protein
MFKYKQVEALLVGLYHVPPEAMGALRGRLKNLKRLGIPSGSHTGKGTRVDYTVEQVWQWAFCLELMECGLDPATIVRIVKAHWPEIRDEFKYVARVVRRPTKDNARFMVLMPLNLMSSTWGGREWTFIEAGPLKAVQGSISGVIEAHRATGTPTRLLAFNLTRVVLAIRAATKEAAPDESEEAAQDEPEETAT